MAKKKKYVNPLLTEEQEKNLQDMVNSMMDVASNLVEEYKDIGGDLDDIDFNDLQVLSGSVNNIVQINENSPFLNEIFEGDSWKRVIGNMPPKKEDNDTE